MKFLILFLPIFIFAKIYTEQIILVTTSSWSSNTGIMKRYEKIDNKWQQIGKTKEVFLGRKGLAWGIGEHSIPKESSTKKEGDKKSPAGIFTLPLLYSYNKIKTTFPYLVSKEYYHCVDDSNSKYYNRVINSKIVSKDYKSFERMKFPKNYYKYALAINHNYFNSGHSISQKGSCIFFHISPAPTVGCTALKSEQDMKELVLWLKKEKNPLLIQAPKSEIYKLLKQTTFMQVK
jgi:D-alanyl-D-alanine dipeptidase